MHLQFTTEIHTKNIAIYFSVSISFCCFEVFLNRDSLRKMANGNDVYVSTFEYVLNHWQMRLLDLRFVLWRNNY